MFEALCEGVAQCWRGFCRHCCCCCCCMGREGSTNGSRRCACCVVLPLQKWCACAYHWLCACCDTVVGFFTAQSSNHPQILALFPAPITSVAPVPQITLCSTRSTPPQPLVIQVKSFERQDLRLPCRGARRGVQPPHLPRGRRRHRGVATAAARAKRPQQRRQQHRSSLFFPVPPRHWRDEPQLRRRRFREASRPKRQQRRRRGSRRERRRRRRRRQKFDGGFGAVEER